MQKLTFRSIGRILDQKSRRKIFLLTIARVAANLLDLIGLAGIALLATSFGSLASGASQRAPLNLPIVGERMINELEAVLIAMVVAGVFLMKSGFSIWLNLLTSLVIASFEGRFSKALAEDYFSPFDTNRESLNSVSEFQNRVLFSTSAISSFLNARITFLAEASLLFALVAIFMLVNPVATISMSLFMGAILLTLNKMIGVRIARNGQLSMRGSEISLQTSRELFGVKREALISGVTSTWIEKFTSARTQAAYGGALVYTLNSMPRYIVETSLVLGIFAFIGGIVIFSDLPSQAVTIGVFMAGGLRLIASILPIQSAFNLMQDGSSRGQVAFNALLELRSRSQDSLSALLEPFDLTGEISFDHVSFKHQGSDVEVLKDISFKVSPKTKVAIVGPSGAGKSTIFDLATGVRQISSGVIDFDGYTPRQVLSHSPGAFGIVTQRPQLVTGTLVENVTLIDHASSNIDKAKEALARAGLHKFTELENWHELQIRPDSGHLSGGEIQRLGLARALYRDPKILFLDEATSALDAETEAEITKVLQALKDEMTVILIAHRLSTVQHADKIIYLDKGKIVAEGTFSELKATVPDFARAVELMDLSDN